MLKQRIAILTLVLLSALAAFGQNTHTYTVVAHGVNLQASGSFKTKGTLLTNNVHGGPYLAGKSNQIVSLDLTLTVGGNTVVFNDTNTNTNTADFGSGVTFGQGVTLLQFFNSSIGTAVELNVFFYQADLDGRGTAADNIVVADPDPSVAVIYTGMYGTIGVNGVPEHFSDWNIVDPNNADGLQQVMGFNFNNYATMGAVTLAKK